MEHVRDHRGEQITQIGIEHDPVKDSQSNGLVERAVQTLEGQVRTMLLALENKISTKINATDDVLPWMIIYAAVLLNIYHVGADNKTARERLRGRKSKRDVVEFGECANWLPLSYNDCQN